MTAFNKFDQPRDGQAPVKLKLSALVKRLVSAREDAAKSRVHWHLTQRTDEELRERLGFTDDDIRTLRGGQFRLPLAHRSCD
jgi:hypothetical protein